MERFGFDNNHTLHIRSVKRVDRDYIKCTTDMVTLDYHHDGREAKDTAQLTRLNNSTA